MQVEQKKVEDLLPYARNARTHSASQVAQIAASIKEFGFNNPVLIDECGSIIAGHGRVLAARKLKMAEVPTITLGHLSQTQKRAYILADNKLAMNAGWNEEMLRLELADLKDANVDLSTIGFDDMTEADEPEATGTEPIQERSEALQKFIDAREKGRAKFNDAVDVNFWVCLVFQSSEQKKEFLDKIPGVAVKYGMYADGQQFSSACGIEITQEYKNKISPKVDKCLQKNIL